MKRLITSASALLLLAACAVGPRYRAPEPANALIANAHATGFENRIPDSTWWHEFGDPTLDGLMTRALTANLDLRIAIDRVRAARAVFVERKFDYAPHVAADGTYVRSREQVPGFGSSRADIERKVREAARVLDIVHLGPDATVDALERVLGMTPGRLWRQWSEDLSRWRALLA